MISVRHHKVCVRAVFVYLTQMSEIYDIANCGILIYKCFKRKKKREKETSFLLLYVQVVIDGIRIEKK